ncbi:MAG: hypothetical protein JNL28_08680 [Planctomycetes bacterium]|nr:hypothetical protein [Planctomycetota bacterium]
MDGASQEKCVLKRDVFGSVELDSDGCVRRIASGSAVPLSRLLARRLLDRERRALARLRGFPGVPQLVERDVERDSSALTRTYIAGVPLHEAESLPVNFFDELDALVSALHARGVCHNDLHKEQNIIVAQDGYPWLVDFQLASVHASGSLRLARRALEDLRHIEKHRRRYTRDGRGPAGERTFGLGAGRKRSLLARVWRRLGKPVYNTISRGILRRDASEARRPSSGPWPHWVAPVAPRR